MHYIDNPHQSPVILGQKVKIFGSVVESYRPKVIETVWLSEQVRWKITLFWETGETSTVYSSDIGKRWVPVSDINYSLN